MTFFASRTFGVPRRRGFWLRCFLSAAILFATALATPTALGQVDCFAYKKLSVPKIEGRVVDPSGAPISKAEVSIARPHSDLAIVFLESDADGSFSYDLGGGEYDLIATHEGFSSAFARVKVRRGIANRRRPIWMILGVGAAEPCPSSTTNEAEFHKIVRNLRRQLEGRTDE